MVDAPTTTAASAASNVTYNNGNRNNTHVQAGSSDFLTALTKVASSQTDDKGNAQQNTNDGRQAGQKPSQTSGQNTTGTAGKSQDSQGRQDGSSATGNGQTDHIAALDAAEASQEADDKLSDLLDKSTAAAKTAGTAAKTDLTKAAVETNVATGDPATQATDANQGQKDSQPVADPAKATSVKTGATIADPQTAIADALAQATTGTTAGQGKTGQTADPKTAKSDSDTSDAADSATTSPDTTTPAPGTQDMLTLLGLTSAQQAAAAQANASANAQLSGGKAASTLAANTAGTAAIAGAAATTTKGIAVAATAQDQSAGQNTAMAATSTTAFTSAVSDKTTPSKPDGNTAAEALHLVSGSKSGTDSLQEKLEAATQDSSGNDDKTSDLMQNVTVVDSRRIIAPVSNNNGVNIAAAMTGNSEWVSAMRSHAASASDDSQSSLADRTMNSLQIKMTPDNLGTVTANLKLTNGELSVNLVVDNSAAYRKLHDDQNSLVSSLKAQGFAVDHVSITMTSSDQSGSNANQNNGQNQSSAQQQAMQQNGGGSSQGGNRPQTRPSYDFNGQTSGVTVDDSAVATAASQDKSGSASGSQLYL
ncbi:flagellar hook-length control protein FliK [Allorhizobium sp. BGMRC 0089]|uniref:flagellar hook-length control protein FliK n=1 Tax=Allorhizobium sonneratiae TaxID=2934936 RepID=UPI002033B0DE|nr:flagellar hook-length control protein FliK [Allorhizobium sonneratiae]MCM2291377.1 flagellar hook-length control protein FliK [Allorhizobium sonneratiae]